MWRALVLAMFVGAASSLFSPDGMWKEQVVSDNLWDVVAEVRRDPSSKPVSKLPSHFALFSMDSSLVERAIGSLGIDQEIDNFYLPFPDGTFERVAVRRVLVAPLIQQQYPQIRTYRVRGLDDDSIRGTLHLDDHGLRARVSTNSWRTEGPESFMVQAVHRTDSGVKRQALAGKYLAFWRRNLGRGAASQQSFVCHHDAHSPPAPPPAATHTNVARAFSSNSSAFALRLAVAATGEFTDHFGGQSQAVSEITDMVNFLDTFWSEAVGVTFTLVSDQSIVFTDASTDPYAGSDFSANLDENQLTVDTALGAANYDVGHLVHQLSPGGGLASSNWCEIDEAARGVSGITDPTGDPFWVDYVSHELGHQFNAQHTFNGVESSCAANRAASTAYEPGSGSTVMAYPGICGSDDLQSAADPFFHFASLGEIHDFLQTQGCVASSTGNAPPSPPTYDFAGSSVTVPLDTPFFLKANGLGAGETAVWEQSNLGAQTSLDDSENSQAIGDTFPLFRSFPPGSSGISRFPRDPANPQPGEYLPTVVRTTPMTFRVTLRGNNNGAFYTSDDITVNLDGTSGPFRVTTTQIDVTGDTISWDVLGTAVLSPNVSISLVEVGGTEHPVVSDTPNDGSYAASDGELQDLSEQQVYIRVESTNPDAPFFHQTLAYIPANSCPADDNVADHTISWCEGDSYPKSNLDVFTGDRVRWEVCSADGMHGLEATTSDFTTALTSSDSGYFETACDAVCGCASTGDERALSYVFQDEGTYYYRDKFNPNGQTGIISVMENPLDPCNQLSGGVLDPLLDCPAEKPRSFLGALFQ